MVIYWSFIFFRFSIGCIILDRSIICKLHCYSFISLPEFVFVNRMHALLISFMFLCILFFIILLIVLFCLIFTNNLDVFSDVSWGVVFIFGECMR